MPSYIITDAAGHEYRVDSANELPVGEVMRHAVKGGARMEAATLPRREQLKQNLIGHLGEQAGLVADLTRDVAEAGRQSIAGGLERGGQHMADAQAAMAGGNFLSGLTQTALGFARPALGLVSSPFAAMSAASRYTPLAQSVESLEYGMGLPSRLVKEKLPRPTSARGAAAYDVLELTAEVGPWVAAGGTVKAIKARTAIPKEIATAKDLSPIQDATPLLPAPRPVAGLLPAPQTTTGPVLQPRRFISLVDGRVLDLADPYNPPARFVATPGGKVINVSSLSPGELVAAGKAAVFAGRPVMAGAPDGRGTYRGGRGQLIPGIPLTLTEAIPQAAMSQFSQSRGSQSPAGPLVLPAHEVSGGRLPRLTYPNPLPEHYQRVPVAEQGKPAAPVEPSPRINPLQQAVEAQGGLNPSAASLLVKMEGQRAVESRGTPRPVTPKPAPVKPAEMTSPQWSITTSELASEISGQKFSAEQFVAKRRPIAQQVMDAANLLLSKSEQRDSRLNAKLQAVRREVAKQTLVDAKPVEPVAAPAQLPAEAAKLVATKTPAQVLSVADSKAAILKEIETASAKTKSEVDISPKLAELNNELRVAMNTAGRNAQKRVASLQDAIGKERTKLPTVTISIPGDGTFKILNTKEALTAFRDRVAKMNKSQVEADRPAVQRRTSGLNDEKLYLQSLKNMAASPDVTKAIAATEARIVALKNKTEPPKTGSGTQTDPYYSGVPIDPRNMGKVLAEMTDYYGQGIIDALESKGGKAARTFAARARMVVDRTKEHQGTLAEVMDRALHDVGRKNAATTWLNTIEPVGQQPWGYRNSRLVTDHGKLVPEFATGAVKSFNDANLAIGRVAQKGNPDFVPSGLMQRQPTADFIDALARGKGPVYETIRRALAVENKLPESKVESLFRSFREELNNPGMAERQLVSRMAQEFSRQLPKMPSAVKVGQQWIDVLHDKPFEYLSTAARRTAARTAFLEVVGDNLANIYRQAISNEGAPAAKEFHRVVRALHQMPTEAYPFGSTAFAVHVLRPVNRVLTDVFASLKLTASALWNIGESAVGNTQSFHGWRNTLKGMLAERSLNSRMERLGAVNKAIYDWSIDPQQPIYSALRRFRNGLRVGTLQQFLNEFQERTAAATAAITAEQARLGRLSNAEKRLLREHARLEGFSDKQAAALADGSAPTGLYDQYIRRAPAFGTGGNLLPAETSAFANSRAMSTLFKFQSYPIMQMNVAARLYRNLARAVESQDPARIRAAAEIAGRWLFGRTMQGAATAVIASLLTGGKESLAVRTQEAQDEPGRFLLESFLAGMGGPLSVIWYATKDRGILQGLTDPKDYHAGRTFPGSIFMELQALLAGTGEFRDLSPPDRLTKYFTTKIPAGRVANTALAAIGLSDHDLALDAATKGFYRWRSAKYGGIRFENELKEDERLEFRRHIKKAVEQMKRGRDFRQELAGAFSSSTSDDPFRSAALSLRGRKLLKNPATGRPLTEQEMMELTNRIGVSAVKKLIAYDAMLESLAWAVQ